MTNHLFYQGNKKLKRAGVIIPFTKEQVKEFAKCANSFKYFCEKYVKIVHVDYGVIPFRLRDYQEELIDRFENNRFVIAKIGRQSGKSLTTTIFVLWKVLFNDNFKVALLANKGDVARKILNLLRLSYEYLPFWLQQGIVEWNKGNIVLENGSVVEAAATTVDAGRGGTNNILILDELAHVPDNQAEEFFTSVYPTISSGTTTKVLIISTPKGYNRFHKMWTEAIEKRNGYVPYEVHWSKVPGRDQKWMEQEIKNLGSQEMFDQEYGTEFLGSQATLISGAKLRLIAWKSPIEDKNNLRIYEKPVKPPPPPPKAKAVWQKSEEYKKIIEPIDQGGVYMITVDIGSGQLQDSSVVCVFRIDKSPYKLVAIYQSNNVNTLIFPNVIFNIAMTYNKAYVLVEVNSIGKQVADILQYDLEYENLLMTETRGRTGQVLGSGSSGINMKFGLEHNKRSKAIGCSNLKHLVETDQLLWWDHNLLKEFSNFVLQKNGTYSAEEGLTDDIVMCCVTFAWAATQDYFKDLCDIDIRKVLYDDNITAIEAEVLPFGQIITDIGIEIELEMTDEMKVRQAWQIVMTEDTHNWSSW